MGELGVIRDAGVLCMDGKIMWAGSMADRSAPIPPDIPELDAAGKTVLPGFVDAHTHMMFAGDRSGEFALRSSGATYQEIAARGGGITGTVEQVRSASKKDLKALHRPLPWRDDETGTTTVEIKSGYGLDMDSEVKMLEAINELGSEEIATVVPTFIAAHAVPPEFRGDAGAYVRLVIDRMIPYAGRKKLARFCDVFCEAGYFDVAQSEAVLTAGRQWGMKPKIHAEELSPLGGAELAARLGAVSADHLEHVSDRGIRALSGAGVVALLLPGVSFFLNHRYAPARAPD